MLARTVVVSSHGQAPSRLPPWLKGHIYVQSAGLAIALGAFAVAIVMVPSELHFASLHGKIGLAVTAALVLLPLQAFICPRSDGVSTAKKVCFPAETTTTTAAAAAAAVF